MTEVLPTLNYWDSNRARPARGGFPFLLVAFCGSRVFFDTVLPCRRGGEELGNLDSRKVEPVVR